MSLEGQVSPLQQWRGGGCGRCGDDGEAALGSVVAQIHLPANDAVARVWLAVQARFDRAFFSFCFLNFPYRLFSAGYPYAT